jgi:hypothetical protein
MKKIIIILVLLALHTFTFAYASDDRIQLSNGALIPSSLVRTAIIVLLFSIVSSFLLTLVRMIMDYRLKQKMIERGLLGIEADNLLNANRENREYAVKWCLLLVGAGIGLTAISTFPFGWLSVAVFAFSIALSFLTYQYYLKRKGI